MANRGKTGRRKAAAGVEPAEIRILAVAEEGEARARTRKSTQLGERGVENKSRGIHPPFLPAKRPFSNPIQLYACRVLRSIEVRVRLEETTLGSVFDSRPHRLLTRRHAA
jgi:hypothetical protein